MSEYQYHIFEISGTQVEHKKYQYAPIVFKKRERQDKGAFGNRKAVARRKDNVYRSVSRFRRIVRSNLVADACPALVTLTVLQILSVKASFRLLTQFFTRCRKHFGRDFKYIAVIEFQSRGATHFHILWWGLPPELVCNGEFKRRGKKKVFYCRTWQNGECECEKRRIQNLWARGYVDCIATDGSVLLAGYLSKYMSKAMFDVRLGGEKAYSCSRNVLRPVRFATRAFSDEVLNQLDLGEPEKVTKRPVRFLGEMVYTRYTQKVYNPSHDIQIDSSTDISIGSVPLESDPF